MSNGGQPPPEGWEERFFTVFEKTHLVSESCKAAGCSKTFVYEQRKKNEEFATRWSDLVDRSTEILEQIAAKRAAESSDVLMMFLLKARRPNVYRENVKHDHDVRVQVGGQVTFLNGAQPIEFEAGARREAARQLLMGSEDIADAEVVEADDIAS